MTAEAPQPFTPYQSNRSYPPGQYTITEERIPGGHKERWIRCYDADGKLQEIEVQDKQRGNKWITNNQRLIFVTDPDAPNWLFFTQDSPKDPIVMSSTAKGHFDEQGLAQGYWKHFSPNGKTVSEVEYKNDEPEGLWKIYNSNGNIVSEYTFRNGKREGPYKYYHPNGTILSEGLYKDGLQEGLCKDYKEDGTLFQACRYEAGQSREKISAETIALFESFTDAKVEALRQENAALKEQLALAQSNMPQAVTGGAGNANRENFYDGP